MRGRGAPPIPPPLPPLPPQSTPLRHPPPQPPLLRQPLPPPEPGQHCPVQPQQGKAAALASSVLTPRHGQKHGYSSPLSNTPKKFVDQSPSSPEQLPTPTAAPTTTCRTSSFAHSGAKQEDEEPSVSESIDVKIKKI